MNARAFRVLRSVAHAYGMPPHGALRKERQTESRSAMMARATVRRAAMYVLHRIGMTYEQIAAELSNHVATVGHHVREVSIALRYRPNDELSRVAARALAEERECLRASKSRV